MSNGLKRFQWQILSQSARRVRLALPFDCTPGVQRYLIELAQLHPQIERVKFHLNESRITVYYQLNAFHEVETWLNRIDVDELLVIYQDTHEFSALNVGKIVTRQLTKRTLQRLFLPKSVRLYWTLYKSGLYFYAALRDLLQRKLTMEVLDSAAVLASIAIGEVESASQIMFILELGERLDAWTLEKSMNDLASSLDREHRLIWTEDSTGQRIQKMTHSIQKGDRVVVQEGEQIHFDGLIVKGVGATQESNLTGEPFPVAKQPGDEVYSNTTLEAGELVIEVTNALYNSRLEDLVEAIYQAVDTQSAEQLRLSRQADRLVKYNFLGLGLTYLLTGNIQKALAFLLVDFSCAIKLSSSVTYMTALREAMEAGIIVKGSTFLDTYDEVDTFVFDKTGTLTESKLTIEKVQPFFGHTYEEVLAIAACLEEHLYHPIAQAVVNKAEDEGITHEEMHGPLTHIASRGIKSSIDGEEVLIGSETFIRSEGIEVTHDQKELIEQYRHTYNLLYLTRGKELIAIFCIATPLRENALEVLRQLQSKGKRIILLTGDTPERARPLQEVVNFDDVKTQVSPQDKVAYIELSQQAGHRVLMIGDGLNDSIAIAQADVGVVMGSASDISRQVSDIIFANDNLDSLHKLAMIEQQLTNQLSRNLTLAFGINLSLIGLGLFGLLPSSMLAMLHNMSTMYIVSSSFKLKKYKKNH